MIQNTKNFNKRTLYLSQSTLPLREKLDCEAKLTFFYCDRGDFQEHELPIECVKGEEIVEAVIHGEKIGTIGGYCSVFLEHLIFSK